MDLHNAKRSLRRELRNPDNHALFETARTRNTAFTNHSTPFSILAALDDRSTTDNMEKDVLTRGLIAEQQRAPNSLWSAILIIAYLPMLGRLRARVVGNPILPDDLDQIVISNFLEVVTNFPLSKWRDYTCVRLRQQTQRRVFRELERQRRDPAFWDFRQLDRIPEDEIEHWSIWELIQSDECASQDSEPLAALLLDYVGDALDWSKLDVVIATTIGGENLWDFIKRHHLTSLDSPSDREYQRVKRQRSRTLAKIRKILTKKLSPTREDSAL